MPIAQPAAPFPTLCQDERPSRAPPVMEARAAPRRLAFVVGWNSIHAITSAVVHVLYRPMMRPGGKPRSSIHLLREFQVWTMPKRFRSSKRNRGKLADFRFTPTRGVGYQCHCYRLPICLGLFGLKTTGQPRFISSHPKQITWASQITA